jgi:hypothetical protein
LDSQITYPEDIDKLSTARDKMLGPESEMTLDEPTTKNGKMVGGTYFERLGQIGVKNTRCYSLSLTHQHPRGVVGPTAAGKVYDGALNDHGKIRKEIVSVRFFVFICLSLLFRENHRSM